MEAPRAGDGPGREVGGETVLPVDCQGGEGAGGLGGA